MTRRFKNRDSFDKIPAVFFAVWVAVALASLTLFGVVIWAVVKLVNHFL